MLRVDYQNREAKGKIHRATAQIDRSDGIPDRATAQIDRAMAQIVHKKYQRAIGKTAREGRRTDCAR